METDQSLYGEALLLLIGAVVAAPLFKRLGLGTVLGYIFAGTMIGPVLRLVAEGEEILHIAELGVVLLLFLIGLELKPSRLWAMRQAIFGLGLLQVMVTGALLTAIALAVGTNFPISLVIGFGLALSSTAFAMQILESEGATNTRYGNTAFAILLFQDLAIAPLIVITTFLAPFGETERSVPIMIATAVGAVAALVIVGRYALNPLFRVIANTGAREVMIATALLLVIGAGVLMQWAGLSMAMGAFIAGVLLAESSYRHELEANIEPFRGILLGLFFIAVGLSLELDVLIENWLLIVVLVPGLVLVKAAVLYGLSRLFRSSHEEALRVAALLPQGGEFGFVLFSVAAGRGIFSDEVASLLIAVVTLSMAVTPLTVRLGDYLASWIDGPDDSMEEDYADAGSDVLLIGFSRFGQITAQVLLAGGCEVTVIDLSAQRVTQAGKFGFRIYYGDGCRKDVLEAAGIRKARVVAVCTHLPSVTNRIVDLVSSEYPQAKLYVRSYDRAHSIELRKKGVDVEIRETLSSALLFGRETLIALGLESRIAREIEDNVRERDEERLVIQEVEGLFAGRDKLLTQPVPEPLIEPRRKRQKTNPVPEPSADAGDGQLASSEEAGGEAERA